MFQFLGYNFLGDVDALNSAPSSVENITSTRITNAIFDHVNITHNTNIPFTTDKPLDWDYDTILNAPLDGSLNAGNVDFMVKEISAVKIKRRIKGTFDWITFKTIPVTKAEDLNFVFNDYLNTYGTEYDYAIVPIMGDVEGNYIINSILSKFNGVFIGNAEQVFKFMFDVQYGNNTRNQQIGTFQPLGRQYPIVIANGMLSYESGSVSGTVLNDDYEETGIVDKVAIVEKRKKLQDFLTDKKPKLLKDWNGNSWLCIITDNIQTNYRSGSGMSIPQVQFKWVQVGDEASKKDLYASGMIDDPT